MSANKPRRACDAFEPDLSAWLDGELLPERRVIVAAHVAACSDCHRLVRRIEGVRGVLRRWDAQETRYAHSTAFRNRVLAEIGPAAAATTSAPAQLAPAQLVQGRRGGARRWSVPASLAAAGALAAVALGYGLVRLEFAGAEQRIAALEGALAARAELQVPTQSAVPPVEQPRLPPVRVDRLGGIVDPSLTVAVPPVDVAYVPLAVEWQERADGDENTLVAGPAMPEHERYELERQRLADELRDRRLAAAAHTESSGTATAGGAPPPRLAQFLASVQLGDEHQDYEHVQVWPIHRPFDRQSAATAMLDLDGAIRRGDLVVSVDRAAEIVIENRSDTACALLLAGDILEGSLAQERVLQEDVYLRPGERRPVRAQASSREAALRRASRFSVVGLVPAGLRSALADGVPQEEYLAESEHLLTELASVSDKWNVARIHNNPKLGRAIDLPVDAFLPRLQGDDVVGFAVSVGEQVVGLEVFGNHALFAAQRERLLRSYLFDAEARRAGETGDELATRADVEALLAGAQKGTFGDDTRVGSSTGSAFRSAAQGSFGYGVFSSYPEGLVHASVFARRARGSGVVGSGTAGAKPGRGIEPGGAGDSGSVPAGPERGDPDAGGGLDPR